MGSNQHRSTAGRTLVSFALLAVVVSAFSVYLWVNRDRDEFTSYPTALGDQDFYTENLGPGFDLFQPNLQFENMPAEFGPGLYRRNHGTVRLEDDKARQFAREKGDRHWVYASPSKDGKRVRFYLKSADNAYIEFGKQKYFPEADDNRPGSQRNPTSATETASPSPSG